LVIRSLSKFLGPDLRVGVSRADDLTQARLEDVQALSAGWVSTALQHLAARLLFDPRVQAQIATAGAVYKRRFTALQRALASLGFAVPGSAGLNLWVPCRGEAALISKLRAQGWVVRAGGDFTTARASAFRVTCASMDDAMREAFVHAVRGALAG
jgi:DNA-binding transcriptional MocR family regulator